MVFYTGRTITVIIGDKYMTRALNKFYALFLIALSLLFILLLPSLKSNAASTSFAVSSVNKVHPGETFTVTISISGNTGIAGFDLELHYSNTSLTLTNVKYSDYFQDHGTTKNSSSYTVIPYSMTWADGKEYSQNSTVATLTFSTRYT